MAYNVDIQPYSFHQDPLSFEPSLTKKKLGFNLHKNYEHDQHDNLVKATKEFQYKDCDKSFWNPIEYSLLYATPLWEGATEEQRVLLNQLYWLAYYSQIISAEIATILYNQTSAAGLFSMDQFKLVCDILDLESRQERTHIQAFKTVIEQTEKALFGERIFSYPMRTPYEATMIFSQTNKIQKFWKWIQLNAYSLLSSNNAFIASQYFAVRGVRTLNGKITQHQLSQFYIKNPLKEELPIPSKISYYHFIDESYHFNSSQLISKEVLNYLPSPTKFERMVGNITLRGCQKDHFHFSTAINGIFWYDPALYPIIYKILRSQYFKFNHKEALEMIRLCFTQENEAMHINQKVHHVARLSYIEYLNDLSYVDNTNRNMSIMAENTLENHIKENKRAFYSFNKSIKYTGLQ